MWRDAVSLLSPQEGAFDEGNARVSCSERSTSTRKVTSGVIWKVRASIALPANKYLLFQLMVTVTSVLGHFNGGEYGHCNENILLSAYGYNCKEIILYFSKWLL